MCEVDGGGGGGGGEEERGVRTSLSMYLLCCEVLTLECDLFERY